MFIWKRRRRPQGRAALLREKRGTNLADDEAIVLNYARDVRTRVSQATFDAVPPSLA